MLRIFFSICFVFATCSAFAQQTLQYYYAQAREAQKSKDYPLFHEMISKASELHPYHQGIMYQRAIAAALTNRNEEAIQYLKEAILIYSPYDLNIDEFKLLQGTKDFEALKTLQKELQHSVIHSDTAFVVKNRTLHLE
jgi:tetratricopeptide (TPR) repeat protein